MVDAPVGQLQPYAVVGLHDAGHRDPAAQRGLAQPAVQDLGQRRAPHDHQRFAQRCDEPVRIWTAQPCAVTPPQRAGGDPTTGVAHRVAQPDLVECRQRVGPDADPGAARGVGALLDQRHVKAAPLQRDPGRKPGDASAHGGDPPRHGMTVVSRP
jgi:hypothetical protein